VINISSPSTQEVSKPASERDTGHVWEREIDGERAIYKWCATCQIWRPPRASHCQYCDNCVREFDHHCPFVSNCIGERNYGTFMLFNLSVVTLLVSVIVSLFAALDSANGPSQTVTVIGIIAVCVFSLIMFCVMFSFFGFHCWLIMTGQTTREQVKQWRSTRHGRESEQGDHNDVDGSHALFSGRRTLSFFRRSPSLIRPRYLVDPQTAARLAAQAESKENTTTFHRRGDSGHLSEGESPVIFHPK